MLVFHLLCEYFFERYILSSLDACSNREFIYWWFINFPEWLNDVLVISTPGFKTSLFKEFISAKNACVRRWSFSISSFLKDWSSTSILKASLQVLFFGIERFETLFETELDFTESFSIRNCKVLPKFSREMFLHKNLVLM